MKIQYAKTLFKGAGNDYLYCCFLNIDTNLCQSYVSVFVASHNNIGLIQQCTETMKLSAAPLPFCVALSQSVD